MLDVRWEISDDVPNANEGSVRKVKEAPSRVAAGFMPALSEGLIPDAPIKNASRTPIRECSYPLFYKAEV